MTVRAAYDALRDFREKRFDTRPRTNKIADGTPLGSSNVIEFEHHEIHLGTVYTRVLAKIGNDERLISRAISSHAHTAAFVERIDVLSMVSP